MIASILVFCASFYYAFFMSGGTIVDGASEGTPAVKDSYQEYKDYVSDKNKGIKSLLEGEQLKEIKLYDLSPVDVRVEPRENPFAKSF